MANGDRHSASSIQPGPRSDATGETGPVDRLLTLTDPRTITYLTNEYSPGSGRILKQTQADGGIWLFQYQLQGATVTGPGCAGIAYLWVAVLGHPARPVAPLLGLQPAGVLKAAQRGAREAARWHRVLAKYR